MVSYDTANPLTIENVEHPIHILGVQAQAMIGCFWLFLIFLTISPLLAPIGGISACVVARLFFVKETEGRPVTFEKYFLKNSKRSSILKHVFPSLDGIIQSEESYHES